MSKATGSKSRSQSSHSRSRSRSRSRSFTRSRSRSRSRSHSRKRKYSPRSRSRSYSPQHNRERNYQREYQPREFRGHRGYRRPFIQRRGRGYYPRGNWNNRGGYGNYGNYNHYGNYRPNWHNYRSTYSPRRGRSRSRSPKRRSISPRSRSRSRYTDKSSSSRSGRSSSSRSRSSPHRSRSPSPKRRSKKTKSSQKEAAASKPPVQEGEDQQKRSSEDGQAGNGSSEAPAGLAPKRSDSWKGLTAYDTSPKHPSPAPRSTVVLKTSPALHSSPSQQSPSLSGAARHASPHGSPGQMSPQSRSPTRPNASHQSPPSLSSTIRNVSRQAPANHSPPAALTQGIAQKEEIRPGMSGLFVEQTAPTISSYLKRYVPRSVVKTEFHVKNVPEKGSRSSQSPKRFKGGVAEEFEKISKAEMRHKFGYDEEEVEEHDKDYPAKNQKEYGYEDELKYRSKLIASKTQERYDEEDEEEEEDDDNDRPRKREEINFFKHITISKEKFREVEEVEEEEELMPEKFKKEERFLSKKPDGNRYREVSPVKALKYKAGRAESPPPPRKSSDSKEQEVAAAQEESTPVLKPTHRPTEVTLKMDSLQFGDDSLGSANVLTHERRLCRDLVHKPKKDQEFRSIFQHIQMAQSRRSPSELFAQHIVTLVHHVKEHYFKSAGVTLNERFTMYQRRTAEQEVPRQKSPEIHRRIDISPSALKKRMHFRDEIKSQKESSYKQGEGKLKDEPDDLRLDIEHRRKYKSKEGEHKKDSSKDSRDSSHSRERSKEKSGKIPKAYKESKKHRKRKKARARTSSSSTSSSSSSPSHEGKDDQEEGVGREETSTGFNKARLGTREFTGPPTRGRARGIFHDDREGDGDNYWANKRGRGTFQRGRGRFLYKKSNTSPKWTHDKYQGSGQEGVEEEEEEEEDDGQVGNIASQEDKKLGTMEQ
ncbi:thyroid hormone receptor-associated protein 3 isoform X4 [Rhincodon typus]|uniref:thyroid hormone receptor-associated protein 3 isoform X4 n=1 Tax=Rhincodon typus TaxID=259920 RepID=UPI0020302E80|nr:thyroid hormone receptor-associated protein 3 isoform X4 [Rhincodon typus]